MQALVTTAGSSLEPFIVVTLFTIIITFASIIIAIQGTMCNLLQRGVCYTLAGAAAAFEYCNELTVAAAMAQF